MPATPTVEERLTNLEKEMAALKQSLLPAQRKPNWIQNITGSFKDDPEFGEILRLGADLRKADAAGADDGGA